VTWDSRLQKLFHFCDCHFESLKSEVFVSGAVLHICAFVILEAFGRFEVTCTIQGDHIHKNNTVTILVHNAFISAHFSIGYCFVWRNVFFVLKVAQNSFQYFPGRRFWCAILTTRYHLMLQSWYQNTAQSPVNTLVSFLWHNRIP